MMMSTLLATLALSATPSSNLSLPPCELGEHYQFEKAECNIELKNHGDRAIRIFEVSASNPNDSIEATTVLVPPHGSAYLKVRISLENSLGITRRYFRLKSNEPGNLNRTAEVRGFTMSVLDDPKPVIDFGTASITGDMPSRSITFSSRERKDFRIIGVLASPDYLETKLSNDGRTLQATLKPSAPWGVRDKMDYVKMRVNTERQSEIWVPIKMDVHGEVIPDINPFTFGLAHVGDKNEFTVRIRNAHGKDFRVGDVKVENIKGRVKVDACTPISPECKLIRFELSDDQPTGAVSGVLDVDLPEYKKTLPIRVSGFLIKKDTVIKDIDEQEVLPTPDNSTGSTSSSEVAGKSLDVVKALKQSVDEPEAPTSPENGPTLRWKVDDSELTYGFVVSRGEAQAGPFVRVSNSTIPARTSARGVSSYYWQDITAKKASTYWYVIEMIEKTGLKKPLSEPQKFVVK